MAKKRSKTLKVESLECEWSKVTGMNKDDACFDPVECTVTLKNGEMFFLCWKHQGALERILLLVKPPKGV